MTYITPVLNLSAMLLALLILGSGCSMFRTSVQEANVTKPVAKPLYPGNDVTDLCNLAEAVNAELVTAPILAKKNVLVVMGIENRTDEHISTKVITDTIRAKLINAGKASFVDDNRRDAILKELGYQLAGCTPETQTLIGRKSGARYMLTGSLIKITKDTSRQISLSKKGQVYFQLTVEVTDIETGLIAWRTEQERVRTASKP